MKKLLLLLLCVPLIGLGQHSLESGFVFGGSLNNFNSNLFPKSSRTNLLSGIDMTYYFSDQTSINSKIIFQPIGYDNNITFTDVTGNVIGEFDQIYNDYFLSVPLVFQYHLGKNKNYFVNAGFSISYLIKKTYTGALIYGQSAGSNANYGEDTYIADLDNANRINTGVVFGLGVLYPMNERINLNFEISTNYGFVFNNKFIFDESVQQGVINTTTIEIIHGEGYYSSYKALLGLSYNIKTH